MSGNSDISEFLPPKVLAAAANGVADAIARDHGDVGAIFARASIDERILESPYNELDLTQFCALFEEAARQTGNDNFGLRFGDDFAPQRLGPIGYVAINSPTVFSALANLVRYFPAHQDNSILTLSEDDGLIWLSYQIIDKRIPSRRQDAELSLGMFLNILRHGLGRDWRPLEIHFEHSAPLDPAEHERRFGAPVIFSQRANAIALRKSDADTIMPNADPYLHVLISEYLAHRRASRAVPQDFVQLLRHHVKLELGTPNAPTLKGVAERFGMTPCTLQRRLKEHGASFNDIVRAARQELALRYVADPDISLTEAALALGYSELSAFSRAFRLWTGMSPQRYRRAAAERDRAMA